MKREYVIDKMAEGIYSTYIKPFKDDANMKFKTWKVFKDCHPNTAQIHINNAEAALDAFLGELPDAVECHNELYKDSPVQVEMGATTYELYQQILAMKEST